MNYRRYFITLIIILPLLWGSFTGLAQGTGNLSMGLNRIEGRIMDDSNMGVNDVYVELYNNYGSVVARQRSSGQGRFFFRGMGPGRYTISVKPYGTNFAEDSRDVEIVNNQFSRSDMVMVDFRLRPDRRFISNKPTIVGTVFAQEVSSDARRLYRAGIEDIQSQPDKALAQLEEAVRLDPRYFDALAALGKSHIVNGKYKTGYPYLLRAIDINVKCADCYYSLALAFYSLKELPAATKAIDAAVLLDGQAPVVRLLQGILYRLNNDFAGAEKALSLAKSLFKEPNAEVHWQLSLVYNRINRNKEAADELEQYLVAKPDITDAQKQSVRELIAKLRKPKQ